MKYQIIKTSKKIMHKLAYIYGKTCKQSFTAECNKASIPSADMQNCDLLHVMLLGKLTQLFHNQADLHMSSEDQTMVQTSYKLFFLRVLHICIFVIWRW